MREGCTVCEQGNRLCVRQRATWFVLCKPAEVGKAFQKFEFVRL